MVKYFKSLHSLETKRPVTREPMLFNPGDMVSSDDLPEHDIERLVKLGDLLPLSPAEAKRDAADAQTQFDTLQLRRSKGLHVDLRHFEETERDLKAKTEIARAVAG
jgi:hypothetical protein